MYTMYAAPQETRPGEHRRRLCGFRCGSEHVHLALRLHGRWRFPSIERIKRESSLIPRKTLYSFFAMVMQCHNGEMDLRIYYYYYSYPCMNLVSYQCGLPRPGQQIVRPLSLPEREVERLGRLAQRPKGSRCLPTCIVMRL